MAVFAPDGGYAFTQVHNIRHNVPVENLEATLAAARKLGAGVQAVDRGSTTRRQMRKALRLTEVRAIAALLPRRTWT